MTATPFYAAILAFLYVRLALRVIRTRRTERVGLGDGDNRKLRRAIRAHGNFAEYAPFALILMAFAELQGAPVWAIHPIGVLLVAGRFCHAFGFGREPENSRLRVIGMKLTFAAITGGAIANMGFVLVGWAEF